MSETTQPDAPLAKSLDKIFDKPADKPDSLTNPINKFSASNKLEKDRPAEPELPVNFATLYHAAMSKAGAGGVPYPRKVRDWAEKSPANHHVLEQLSREGRNHPLNTGNLFRLIDEILKEVR